MRSRTGPLIWALLLLLSTSARAGGGLSDFLGKGLDMLGGGGRAEQGRTTDVAAGLREALVVGVDRVVGLLGRPGGFLDNPAAHIPLPKPLDKAQGLLRQVGLSELADDLERRMNRAAERAVPLARDLFTNAIAHLRFEDAMEILKGPPDAATRYLERVSGGRLREEMRPIVEDELAETGALKAFDGIARKYGALPLAGKLSGNLTDHVLDHAEKALFTYLAEQERQIRENPAARTTELLRKVFGG